MKSTLPGIAALLAAAWVSLAVAEDQEKEPADQPAVQYELLTQVETDPVSYRKFVKQAMEAHLAAFGLILTQKAPGTEHLPFHAEALVTLVSMHTTLYPEGSETAATSDHIWMQPDRFRKAADATTKRAQELRETLDKPNYYVVMNQLVRLGESCESCHAQFRTSGAE